MKVRYDPQSGALYIRLTKRGPDTQDIGAVEGAYLDIDIMGRLLRAEFLSLEEFAEFASRQGKESVELPDRPEDPVLFQLDLD